jgi:hypothetical protein
MKRNAPFAEPELQIEEFAEPQSEVQALRDQLAIVEAERDRAVAQVVLLKNTLPAKTDGLTIPITFSPDDVLRVSGWIEGTGMTLEEFLQQQVGEALTAYWGG